MNIIKQTIISLSSRMQRHPRRFKIHWIYWWVEIIHSLRYQGPYFHFSNLNDFPFVGHSSADHNKIFVSDSFWFYLTISDKNVWFAILIQVRDNRLCPFIWCGCKVFISVVLSVFYVLIFRRHSSAVSHKMNWAGYWMMLSLDLRLKTLIGPKCLPKLTWTWRDYFKAFRILNITVWYLYPILPIPVISLVVVFHNIVFNQMCFFRFSQL